MQKLYPSDPVLDGQDDRILVTEAWIERVADRRIQSLLAVSSKYRNAATAEEQSEVEERISHVVMLNLGRQYRTG